MIWLRHLFRLKTVTNLIFLLQKRPIFLHLCGKGERQDCEREKKQGERESKRPESDKERDKESKQARDREIGEINRINPNRDIQRMRERDR